MGQKKIRLVRRNKSSSRDEINYLQAFFPLPLEVETESHFQPELRTVFVYIPINGRFNGDLCVTGEKCITGLHAEAETGFISTVPIVTVQVYAGSQEKRLPY